MSVAVAMLIKNEIALRFSPEAIKIYITIITDTDTVYGIMLGKGTFKTILTKCSSTKKTIPAELFV